MNGLIITLLVGIACVVAGAYFGYSAGLYRGIRARSAWRDAILASAKSPGFHVRNVVSNYWLRHMNGGDDE